MHSLDKKDSGSNESQEAVDTYSPIGKQETPRVNYFEEQHPFKVLSELETNRSYKRNGQMPPQYGENNLMKGSASLKSQISTEFILTMKPTVSPRLPVIPAVHV